MTLTEVTIEDDLGIAVIDVVGADTTLDLGRLTTWAVKALTVGTDQVEIVLSHAYAYGPNVFVDVDQDNWTGIGTGFYDRTAPSRDVGVAPRIEIYDAQVRDGRVRIYVDRNTPVLVDSEGIEAIGATVIIDDGRTWATGPSASARSGRLHIGPTRQRGGAPGTSTGLTLPWRDLRTVHPTWSPDHFELSEGRTTLSESPVVLSGHVDSSGLAAWIDCSVTATLARDPLLSRLFGAAVTGSVTLVAQGPASFPHLTAELLASEMRVGDLDLAPLVADVTLDSDPWRDRVRVIPRGLSLFGSEWSMDELAWRPDGTGGGALDLALTLEDTRTDDVLLGLAALGIAAPEPPATGSLSGQLGGRLVTSDSGWRGELDIDVTGDVDVLPRYGLAGGGLAIGTVELTRGGFATSGLALHLGELRTRIDGHMNMDGHLDLGGGLRLPVAALGFESPECRSTPIAHPMITSQRRGGSCPAPLLDGELELQQTHVTGALPRPEIRTRARLGRGRLLGERLDDAAATLTFGEGNLAISDAVVNTPWISVSGDAAVTLLAPGGLWLHPEMPLTIPRATVSTRDLGGLAQRIGASDPRIPGAPAAFELTNVTVPLRAARPWRQLRGGLSGTLSDVSFFGERVERISVAVDATDRRFTLKDFEVRATGGATLKASGHYAPGPDHLDLKATATGLTLPQLQRIATGESDGLAGIVGVELAISGERTDPKVSGTVTAADVVVGKVVLGDAQLDLEREPGERRVSVRSPRFFPTLSLEKGTVVLGDSGLPTLASFTIGLEDLDLKALAGKSLSALTSARLAHGTLNVSLSTGGGTGGSGAADDAAEDTPGTARRSTDKPPLRVTIDVPNGGLIVGLDASTRVENRGTLSARYDGSVVELERAVLAIGQYALAACGTLTPSSGAVLLDVAGSLDLSTLPGLRRRLTGARGRLVTHSVDPTGLKGPFDDSCLLLPLQLDGAAALGSPSGYVRIGSTLAAPTVNGAILLDGIAVRPRGLGREVAIDHGTVRIDSSSPDAITLRIDESAPFEGNIDEGSFTLTGRATLPVLPERRKLAHWLPSSGSVTVRGQDIGYLAPKEYRLVLDPDLTLRFDDLYQPTDSERKRWGLLRPPSPALRLGGRIIVAEGEYFRTFAVLAKSIGQAFGPRSVDAASKDIGKLLPLVDAMRLDVEVQANNFLVDADFGVGSASLDSRFDLRLGGTFESPTVNGNVEVVDGTIVYNVFRREFEVTEGRLEFDGSPSRPVLDIRAETNIEVRKTNRFREVEDFEDYAIAVEVKGRIPDYELAFTSKPSLPEIDIQYLILLGRTKQQIADEGAAGGSLDVVSADLTSLVSSLVQAPFVDELTVEPTLGGGGRVEAVLKLGRGIRFGLVGRQDTAGNRSYDARYRHRILDRLLLEAARRSASETTGERDRYEVQLEYTIPLDP
ncbi:MAG: translocation/assembly module TamB domain-containing protein [Myxococcales bacterium]|nr:translocation/assembly module TamB domain-containing protein [Myxococcales bacterium]